MNQDIKKILEELYALDESLQKREPELVKSLEYLLAARPEAKVDRKFARQLRSQLLKKARENSTTGQSILNIFNFTIMNKIAFAAGGAALALIIAIPLLSNKDSQSLNSMLKPASEDISFEADIIETKANAFGSLATISQNEQARGLGSASADMMALTESAVAEESVPVGESMPAAAPTAMEAKGLGGGGGIMVGTSMIMPYQQFEYVYKGGDFDLPDGQVAVLRRVKGSGAAADLARRVGNIDFGVMDLGSFTNQEVQNISVAEDKEFGYMVNANLTEGMINIGQNWQRWPQINYDERLSLSDFPADNQVIAIADKFLKEHNISTAQYAAPIVRNDWRLAYEQSPDKSMFYIPDQAQVVYPLIVNGQVVYDQGGNESGLLVSVNIRFNRVSNVSGLTSQQYESSQYQAVTDINQVMEIVKRGNIYPVLYRDGEAEVTEVSVGTPQQVLSRFYHYKDGETMELLVPALVFPILDKPDGYNYYSSSIVVPLVADLLPDSQPMPEPMPIKVMEEAQ